MAGPHVAQLFPDMMQARILRSCLLAYSERNDISEDHRDAALELLVKLTRDMRS